jgi:exosortase
MHDSMDRVPNAVPAKKPQKGQLNLHIGTFGIFTIAALVLAYHSLEEVAGFAGILAYGPTRHLVRVPANSEYYSHILLIPIVSVYFLFEKRREILGCAKHFLLGLPIAAAGLIIYVVALSQRSSLGDNDFASLATAGSLIFWWGGFLFSFGPEAFRIACFPLLFLIFAIPVPQSLLEGFIHVLQVGSAEVTEWLFQLTGTSYIREGFLYQLPGINIQVAKECSGIRSSLALIITGVVAGHLFLGTSRSKLILLLTVVPFTIFKNGIRIVTLSLLAIHVNPKFITDSFLHHSGGFLFYLPALVMLAAVLWWLRRAERKSKAL